MFHAPMVKFQLELIYYFTYFSTVVPSNICMFLSYLLFYLFFHRRPLLVFKLFIPYTILAQRPAYLNLLDLFTLAIMFKGTDFEADHCE